MDCARTRHAQRRAAAPGLAEAKRTALLRQWKRQGRRCAYCPALATTIDHVVPLIRGGSNGEGNLVPACRPCNSSKGGRLLTEWRTGRRCTVNAYVLPAPPRTKRAAKPAHVWPTHCRLCAAHMGGAKRTYCTPACATEWNVRNARERYRRRDLTTLHGATRAWRDLASA